MVQSKAVSNLPHASFTNLLTHAWSALQLGSLPVPFLLKLDKLAARENGFGRLLMRALGAVVCE